ncbi:MAG: 6-phospho-beta-glucosidase [Defluviitaleaceae bacterium]|nr:6-phospho-beta-glucosidase [Defluviitaleaceae bacterium]MCL2836154.1 6-phospho-beta-glucosidase [Defluviitaleaceae bacterium]
MKIAIIGAGSTYTPELIEGIIDRALPLGSPDVFLYDIDSRKLNMVGGFAKRMVETSGVKCGMVLSMDLDETLKNADFVLCQLRVGGMAARIRDEKIPLKHNLLGQETMGIGGFFNALRTVPVMLDIARKMERLCPGAALINFANPAGLVTQAVSDNSAVKIYGVCNNPYNMKKGITEKLEIENPTFDYIGLNHLSWITGIYANGENYIEKALTQGVNSGIMQNIPKGEFDAELISAIKGIPSFYLRYIYKKDESLRLAKEAEQTRGEKALEIENDLLEMYADVKLDKKPDFLKNRGGANYSLVAISLVDAILNDKQEQHVVNLRNNGAVSFLKDSDVIETTAIVGKDTAKPLPLTNVSPHIIGYMQAFKTYENYAVLAAVKGCREAAICAMLANPLICDYDAAIPCFDEMLAANKEYLQNWTE